MHRHRHAPHKLYGRYFMARFIISLYTVVCPRAKSSAVDIKKQSASFSSKSFRSRQSSFDVISSILYMTLISIICLQSWFYRNLWPMFRYIDIIPCTWSEKLVNLNATITTVVIHFDDVMTWKFFPYCWHFVRGIHDASADSPFTGPLMQRLVFCLLVWTICWTSNRFAVHLGPHDTHMVSL